MREERKYTINTPRGTTVKVDEDYYNKLADVAERGELGFTGEAVHRQDGSRIAPELSLEEAAYVAMGRPRKLTNDDAYSRTDDVEG